MSEIMPPTLHVSATFRRVPVPVRGRAVPGVRGERVHVHAAVAHGQGEARRGGRGARRRRLREEGAKEAEKGGEEEGGRGATRRQGEGEGGGRRLVVLKGPRTQRRRAESGF